MQKRKIEITVAIDRPITQADSDLLVCNMRGWYLGSFELGSSFGYKGHIGVDGTFETLYAYELRESMEGIRKSVEGLFPGCKVTVSSK